MAVVSQIINMTPLYVPYERPPQNLTLWSAIPRGLQSFIVESAGIEIKPINDDIILSLRATLPQNFGYVLQDVMFNIASASSFAWSSIMSLNLQSYFRGIGDGGGLSSTWAGELELDDGLGSNSRSSFWHDLPTFPMIGTDSGIAVNLTAVNGADPAAGVGVVNCFISFWQFDLEQIRKYPINSPIPTQSR